MQTQGLRGTTCLSQIAHASRTLSRLSRVWKCLYLTAHASVRLTRHNSTCQGCHYKHAQHTSFHGSLAPLSPSESYVTVGFVDKMSQDEKKRVTTCNDMSLKIIQIHFFTHFRANSVASLSVLALIWHLWFKSARMWDLVWFLRHKVKKCRKNATSEIFSLKVKNQCISVIVLFISAFPK